MADRCEDTREEEGASSPVRQELPVSQSDDAFRAQLLAVVSMFSQVMQNPSFWLFCNLFFRHSEEGHRNRG